MDQEDEAPGEAEEEEATPPDREPQTPHEKHDTRPVTAVRFASIDVENTN
jgi:hypothetical protein